MHAMKDMTYHIRIRAKLYLNNRCKQIVAANDGAARFTYNRLVAVGNELYRLRKTADLCQADRDRIEYLESVVGDTAHLKNSAPFLYENDIDSSAVDNAIKNYHTAWKNMRERHTGVPTFHKKSYEQSYQTCNHYNGKSTHMNDGSTRFIGSRHIQLPLLGKTRIGISKKQIQALLAHADMYETRIGTACISRDAVGEYWVALQIGSMHPFKEQMPKTGEPVGIDLNLENFLTDSNGNVTDNPRILRKSEARLAKEQRVLSHRCIRAKADGRSIYESRNYQKQRIKVAYTHRKISRQRADFHDVLSKDMVKSHDYIVAEDLKVRNLKKNHHLAKAISDAGWRSFLTGLSRKAEMYGKTFVLINPSNTTQTCSCCGYVLEGNEKLTLKDREWDCPQCGAHHLRDHNSAINVLNKGLALKK